MSSNEMPIEEARKQLGDLAIAAMHGQTTVLTRYGKPVAMLVPYATQEPAVATMTENPLNLSVFDVTGYAPRHEVTDPGKADRLTADMKTRGWQGAPLVVLRNYAQALTGVHRLAAAERAGLATVPGVDAEELLAACGIDLWERREEYDLLDDALEALLGGLPADIRAAYGIDLR